jgi:hypothetical protein
MAIWYLIGKKIIKIKIENVGKPLTRNIFSEFKLI